MTSGYQRFEFQNFEVSFSRIIQLIWTAIQLSWTTIQLSRIIRENDTSRFEPLIANPQIVAIFLNHASAKHIFYKRLLTMTSEIFHKSTLTLQMFLRISRWAMRVWRKRSFQRYSYAKYAENWIILFILQIRCLLIIYQRCEHRDMSIFWILIL